MMTQLEAPTSGVTGRRWRVSPRHLIITEKELTTTQAATSFSRFSSLFQRFATNCLKEVRIRI
jgi:hypothetical protein